MMRESVENNHETSRSTKQRLSCCEVSGLDGNIPMDLTVEILKKLPAKSLSRFRCVSKQWSSVISSRRDFIDSIVARYLTQPLPRDTKLILHHHSQNYQEPSFFIFSSTYPQNTDKEAVPTMLKVYQYVRGLICVWSGATSPGVAIYNPTTRQYLPLPNTRWPFIQNCLFGYDPFKNQYKVLCLPYKKMEEGCQIYTLADPTAKQWRNVNGTRLHYPLYPPVCINGTIYYRASTVADVPPYFLASFDVYSEKFGCVEAPKTLIDHKSTLIKYQGKLGFMCCQKGVEIWVMEDGASKQEWSKIFFYPMRGFEDVRIAGVTDNSEIVMVRRALINCDTLYVFYYDPKRNSVRSVEVEGTMVKDTKHKRKHLVTIWAVPDHVENTMRL